MKVWVVLNQWDYENTSVEAVKDNEQAAAKMVDEGNKKTPHWDGWYHIEMEVTS